LQAHIESASEATKSLVQESDNVVTPPGIIEHTAEDDPFLEKEKEGSAPADEKMSASMPMVPVTPERNNPRRTSSHPDYHPSILHPMTPRSNTITGTNTPSPRFDTTKNRPASPFGSIRKKREQLVRTPSVSSTGSSKKKGRLTRSPSLDSSASGKKKVGFLDKVRGEAKIVMGKIENKQEKVEAGKRILHGEY